MSDSIARLRKAEMRRQRARQDQAEAKAEMVRLIEQARSEGMTMVAIAEQSGISRENLYQLLRS
jgi:DNA-binding phage protein